MGMKLSLFNSDDNREETVELDDELTGKFLQVVDETPELTVAEALRQGVQHVVDRANPSAG
jgi:hypothetical protein